MIYLKNFTLLTDYQENKMFECETRKIYNSYYPVGLFSSIGLNKIEFSNITIFCGGNGCGKSTLLNIIASKINASRRNRINKGSFFDLYVDWCKYDMFNEPFDIKMITSDDVFDYLLDVRSINMNVNRRKESLSREYINNKYSHKNSSLSEYNELKDSYDAKTKTMSAYVRQRLVNNNIIEHSNGESALEFWEKEIDENSIYILDEPENSLSCDNQIKLKQFIEDSARFYNCQFIISTHSPFLLSLKDALIYDLDSNPVITKKWTELDSVKTYKNFFDEHSKEFKNN